MLATATVSLAISWWFVRRVEIPDMSMTWAEAVAEAKPMVSLGIALMTSTVLSMTLEFYTRSLINRSYGVEAVGIYQAAWSLSGMFAGFVLTAMGTDFYPRLTAVIHDRVAAIREINEQTEIGRPARLAGPAGHSGAGQVDRLGAVFVCVRTGHQRTRVDVAGCVRSCRVVANGLRATGPQRGQVVHRHRVLLHRPAGGAGDWMVPRFGVVGAAYAFFGCYASYFIGMSLISRRLIGFRHSPDAIRLILVATLLMVVTMAVSRLLPDLPAPSWAAFCVRGGLWCLRGLSKRLGADHRLIRMVVRIPGIARVVAKREPNDRSNGDDQPASDHRGIRSRPSPCSPTTRRHYVAEAVRGALSQQYRPLQVILSDDASTDRTFEIMTEASQAVSGRCLFGAQSEYRKTSAGEAHRSVIGMAKGKYVVMSAGDDVSLPERTGLSVDALINDPRGRMALHSAVTNVDAEGRVLFVRENPHRERLDSPEAVLAHDVYLTGSSVTVDRWLYAGFPACCRMWSTKTR
jgi:hypothetical protein